MNEEGHCLGVFVKAYVSSALAWCEQRFREPDPLRYGTPVAQTCIAHVE
jgi:hypothetical protein